jgi:hypothetical protein
MFEVTSRYINCGDAKIITDGNETIRYKKRRFIPIEKESQIILLEVDNVSGNRIDLISSKYLGDSEQFWKLCDMNRVMHPLDLTDDTVMTIKIIGDN